MVLGFARFEFRSVKIGREYIRIGFLRVSSFLVLLLPCIFIALGVRRTELEVEGGCCLALQGLELLLKGRYLLLNVRSIRNVLMLLENLLS